MNECKCTGKAGESVQSNGCTIHNITEFAGTCEDCDYKPETQRCKEYIPISDFVGFELGVGQDWPRCKTCLHAAECHN